MNIFLSCQVQLHLNAGDIPAAITSLEGLQGEDKFRPGIVSALVALYLATRQRPKASNILEQTVDWYRKTKGASADLTTLWRQAADFHLRGGNMTIIVVSSIQIGLNSPLILSFVFNTVFKYKMPWHFIF